jgi:hypothetical protein
VEVVLAAHDQNSESILSNDRSSVDVSQGESLGLVSFPWVLTVLNVKAFDFFRVCESFIKAEPSIPKALIKHISTIETRILECLAWQVGSPLFDAIHLR